MSKQQVRLAGALLIIACLPFPATGQGDGPPLSFVELSRGVYTFKRGKVVVKAGCDYSIAYATNGKKKEMKGFCPLNQLPGDTIAENGLYAKQESGDRYGLSNEYVVVETYQYCTTGGGCVDKLRISREVWFHIISMKNGGTK